VLHYLTLENYASSNIHSSLLAIASMAPTSTCRRRRCHGNDGQAHGNNGISTTTHCDEDVVVVA